MEYTLLGSLTVSNLLNFILVVIVVAISRSASRYITDKFDRLLTNSDNAREHFSERLATVEGVNQILDSLICDYKADRVALLEFHNGGTNVCGLPFAKVSCTHERCSVGVKLQAFHIKDYPIALFGYLVTTVLNNKHIVIPNIEALRSMDATTYQFWSENGAASLYAKLVRTLDGHPIGLLIMEYNTIHALNDDDMDALDHAAYAVGVLHSVREEKSDAK
jgi:hypothetical protein